MTRLLTSALTFTTFLLITSGLYAQPCNQPDVQIQHSGRCQYQAVRFNADLIKGAHYEWDFNGDGQTDTSGLELANVSGVYASTGSFEAKLMLKVGMCEFAYSSPVFITSVSRAIMDIEQNCGTLSLQSYSSNFDSLEWQISDGTTSNQLSFKHELKMNGRFEVRLNTYKNGCLSSQMKEVSHLAIHAKPTVKVNSNCAPAKVQLINASIDGAVYTWYLDKKEVGHKAVFDTTLNESGRHTIGLRLENDFGCVDSASVEDAIILATPLNPEYTVDKQEICAGGTVYLSGKAIDADKITWVWGDGSQTNGDLDPNHDYVKAGVYTVKLIAERSATNCVDTFFSPVAINVQEQPVSSLVFKASEGCVPFDLPIVATAAGDYDEAFLVVNDRDTLDLPNQSIHFTNGGLNVVKLITRNNSGGCEDIATQAIRLTEPLNTDILPQLLDTRVEGSELKLRWKGVANSASYKIFQIEGNDIQEIGEVEDTTWQTNVYRPDSVRYAYMIQSVGKCGGVSGLSIPAKNLMLTGSYKTDSFPTLRWDEVESWEDGVAFYEVKRDIGYGWEVVEQTKLPFFVDYTFDNNASLTASYRVSAVKSDGSAESYSNSISFEFAPNIFIPSAFTPNYDNVNDRYEVKGYGFGEMNIKIYNRQGQEVFDSEGENLAWDGTYGGELVDPGVYICVVKATNLSGQTFDFQQTVTVLR